MPSNVQRGSYYKARTKRWLEGEGYVVAHLEQMHLVHRPGRPPLPIKRDQLGCDLLAVNAEHALFVQVKFFGTADRRSELSLRDARAELAKYPCPPCARQVIVVWTRGARTPRVV